MIPCENCLTLAICKGKPFISCQIILKWRNDTILERQRQRDRADHLITVDGEEAEPNPMEAINQHYHDVMAEIRQTLPKLLVLNHRFAHKMNSNLMRNLQNVEYDTRT